MTELTMEKTTEKVAGTTVKDERRDILTMTKTTIFGAKLRVERAIADMQIPWSHFFFCCIFRHSSSGLSYDGNDGPVSYAESAEIMSKKYMERDQVKLAMEQQERTKRLQKIRARRQHIDRWQQKTAKSPFHVNLVAETERLDEEHRLRASENARRAKELDKRARLAKSEVIIKALTETSDLELLRREKRAIIEEEKRLKALMDLEKTNSHRKMDLIAAKNAEKKRRQEKESYRRGLRQQEIEEREFKYKELLKEKLAIGEPQ